MIHELALGVRFLTNRYGMMLQALQRDGVLTSQRFGFNGQHFGIYSINEKWRCVCPKWGMHQSCLLIL
jgi:hypothetical protein